MELTTSQHNLQVLTGRKCLESQSHRNPSKCSLHIFLLCQSYTLRSMRSIPKFYICESRGLECSGDQFAKDPIAGLSATSILSLPQELLKAILISYLHDRLYVLENNYFVFLNSSLLQNKQFHFLTISDVKSFPVLMIWKVFCFSMSHKCPSL